MTRAFLHNGAVPLDDLWVDPTIVDEEGRQRGVWFHRLVD